MIRFLMNPLARRTDGLAYVFDLDGVIVDSNPVHAKVWREYLETLGLRPPANFAEKMFGRHNDDIVRSFFGAGLSETGILQHGAAKEALYRETMKPVLRRHLVPGIAGFLEAHRARPMAVASNAEPANVQFVLENADLRRYFRFALDGSRVRRPKPDPQIYLLAAELLRVAPADCVVFEDSPAGVEAAKAAGARVVCIETTYRGLPNVDLSVRDFLDPELERWLHAQKSCG